MQKGPAKMLKCFHLHLVTLNHMKLEHSTLLKLKFSLHLIQNNQLQRLSNVKFFSLGLTLARTPEKFSFIDQNADL